MVENVERIREEEPELSPAEATKKAMPQVTGPISAITMVLFSVFLPVGFVPGISGELFRQFAVTISAASAMAEVAARTRLRESLVGGVTQHLLDHPVVPILMSR